MNDSTKDLDHPPVHRSESKMEEDWQNLSFKVDPEFHVEFKTTASRHRISMKKLLEEGFDLWKAENQ